MTSLEARIPPELHHTYNLGYLDVQLPGLKFLERQKEVQRSPSSLSGSPPTEIAEDNDQALSVAPAQSFQHMPSAPSLPVQSKRRPTPIAQSISPPSRRQPWRARRGGAIPSNSYQALPCIPLRARG